MNPIPDRGRPLRIDSLDGVLAVIPHILGYVPHECIVILGIEAAGRLRLAFRFDLPSPSDPDSAAAVANHAISMLAREHMDVAIVVGYGPGHLVTTLADAFRTAAGAGVRLRDVVRVEDGRYWSYMCRESSCCPPHGTPFDPSAHPAAQALASADRPVLASRDALAATIAPVTGPQAEAMTEATQRAERAGLRLVTTGGMTSLETQGLTAIRGAIQVYREGGAIRAAIGHAWLALVLLRLRIRDDAWARMDPAFCQAHRRLWTDLVHRAQPGYVAAPGCLLAITAWQGGDGALANLALDRALADARTTDWPSCSAMRSPPERRHLWLPRR